MKNLWFLVVTIFLSVSWLVIGCGIPQEDYDALTAQLNNVQGELQSVKAELGTTKSELEAKKAELETANADLKTMQAKLETAQKELLTFKEDLKMPWGPLAALLRVSEALNALESAVLLNQPQNIPTLAATVSAVIAAPDLKAMWEQAYVTDATGSKLYVTHLEKLISTVDSRIKDYATVIRTKLLQ